MTKRPAPHGEAVRTVERPRSDCARCRDRCRKPVLQVEIDDQLVGTHLHGGLEIVHDLIERADERGPVGSGQAVGEGDVADDDHLHPVRVPPVFACHAPDAVPVGPQLRGSRRGPAWSAAAATRRRVWRCTTTFSTSCRGPGYGRRHPAGRGFLPPAWAGRRRCRRPPAVPGSSPDRDPTLHRRHRASRRESGGDRHGWHQWPAVRRWPNRCPGPRSRGHR